MNITNKNLKRRIIDISYRKKLSHIGSCLTAVDIIDEIFKTKKPDDKFVLSSGHAGLALYVVLEKYGGKNAESIFDHHGVHPDRCIECGINCSGGSLGHGIGIAVGMALADRSHSIYCLISDGECAEGSVWEALHIAYKRTPNLKIYLNFNEWGAYQPVTPKLLDRIKVFNPNVEVRHNNFDILLPILREPQEAHYKVMDEEEYTQIMEILK